MSEFQETDNILSLLSDLMASFYAEFLQPDRPQGNWKLKISSWFPWSSCLVVEIKLYTPNAFCSWRSLTFTKTCTCRFRRPRLLLIHWRYKRACYILSVVICWLISWPLRESQKETYHHLLIVLLTELINSFSRSTGTGRATAILWLRPLTLRLTLRGEAFENKITIITYATILMGKRSC